MPDDPIYDPPAKIEDLYAATAGNNFAGWNRPFGPWHDKHPIVGTGNRDVPAKKGSASFQLYSLATPNGMKIGILLEELGIDYDAWVVNIGMGQQFQKGFSDVNPNGKIPCAVDHAPADGGKPVNLFESGSMMVYLAEKHNRFIPSDPRAKAECMNWVMWQMAGQGPMTGNFGHFQVYAPPSAVSVREYGAARYGMEVQRLCDVLDHHLSDGRKFICGDMYTIADMIILPWFAILRNPKGYRHTNGVMAKDFLGMDKYKHAIRWAEALMKRPQVQRGMLVCRGKPKPWLVDKRFTHLAKL